MTHRATATTAICLATLITGCSPEPKVVTYEDCVLQSVGEASTNQQILQVRRSCYAKFPAYLRGRELAEAELREITGRGALNGSNGFDVTLYNGNPHLTVRYVVVEIRNGEAASRQYSEGVTIPPLSTARLTLQLLPSAEETIINWSIDRARGD